VPLLDVVRRKSGAYYTNTGIATPAGTLEKTREKPT